MSMDIAKYKEIVTTMRPLLLKIAVNITRSKEDAEDIVQETCLRLWHGRSEFGGYENIEAFCCKMTKNMSIDKVRTRKISMGDDALMNLTDNNRLPDEILEEKETNAAIRKIIAMLPQLQQQVLRLKDIEGCETEEIVAITGISVESVRNNLSRARKKVRELYGYYLNRKS